MRLSGPRARARRPAVAHGGGHLVDQSAPDHTGDDQVPAGPEGELRRRRAQDHVAIDVHQVEVAEGVGELGRGAEEPLVEQLLVRAGPVLVGVGLKPGGGEAHPLAIDDELVADHEGEREGAAHQGAQVALLRHQPGAVEIEGAGHHADGAEFAGAVAQVEEDAEPHLGGQLDELVDLDARDAHLLLRETGADQQGGGGREDEKKTVHADLQGHATLARWRGPPIRRTFALGS